MNIQQEQIVEALVYHQGPQEGLDPMKVTERPFRSGTCDHKHEVQLEQLVDLTEHALDHLVLV